MHVAHRNYVFIFKKSVHADNEKYPHTSVSLDVSSFSYGPFYSQRRRIKYTVQTNHRKVFMNISLAPALHCSDKKLQKQVPENVTTYWCHACHTFIQNLC
jgi:hypothetical protein